MKVLAGRRPERTCTACRKKSAKMSLLRFVVSENGLTPDLKMVAKGRGFYACRDSRCVKRLLVDARYGASWKIDTIESFLAYNMAVQGEA